MDAPPPAHTTRLVAVDINPPTAKTQVVTGPSTTAALVIAAEVLVAFVIAWLETAGPFSREGANGVSAVGLWILVVSLLLPAQPRWTLIAGLAAATTWPIAYALNIQRVDAPMAPWTQLLVWIGLNYVMAVVAWLVRRRTEAPSASTQTSDGLGSYRLLSPIGAGGMGEVWKATHQMLARKAAIKLVRPRTPTTTARLADQWVKRFQREANVIAGLQSPHTIYLYDFGVANDGQFYYVMELLDGVSLQTLVTTFGPQPPARVRHIMLQICTSLEEAHAQALVHRDLKPSNVMLCKVALNYDFVKVLDFGLAKCAACEDGGLSQEGVGMGTPAYIAPEVALGEADIDGRADIYGLGCVAYFLLTGTLVFDDPNPMTMALKHVQTQPPPPSSRTELPIPPELERIVMQCLEKAPDSRPASARTLASMLEACDLPAWTQNDAASWWARHLPATSSLRVSSVESGALQHSQ